MATLFHSTTRENFESILREGYRPKQTVWNCSDECHMYGYDLSKFIEHHEDEPTARVEAIWSSIGNGFCAAISQNYQGNEIITMEIEIDNSLIEDDCSCPNVSDIASIIHADDFSIDKIKKVYSCKNYKPSLRIFHMHFFQYKELFEFNLTEDEADALKAIKDVDLSSLYEILNDYSYDELEETEWKTLSQ